MNTYALATMLALCAPAMAQSTYMRMPEGTKDIDLTLASFYGPSTAGSRERTLRLLPLISVQWANGYFINMNQIGVHLPPPRADIRYGLVAVPTFSRRTTLAQGQTQTRNRFTPELGGFLSYTPSKELTLSSSVLYGGSSDHRGVRMDLSAELAFPAAQHHVLGLRAAALLANRSALEAEFAVPPAEATPRFAAYEVQDGVHSVAIGANWRWHFKPKYRLATSLQWQRLQGSAAASPRTEQPSAVSVSGMLIYSY